jgi:hypothetical protein
MAMVDSFFLSNHFTPWFASPYHLLHPFMQPIMPTTILVLVHIEKSKQNQGNKKQLQQNQKKHKKTLLRGCGFDSKDCFFLVVLSFV